MKRMVLLGAGASAETGIPTSYEMAKAIIAKVSEKEPDSTASRVLTFVAGGLLFKEGQKGGNPFDGIDVEELFSAVTVLGDRQNLDVAPFLGTWHPTVEQLDRGNLEEFLRQLSYVQPFEEFVKFAANSLRHNRYTPRGGYNQVEASIRTAIQQMLRDELRERRVIGGSSFETPLYGIPTYCGRGEIGVALNDYLAKNFRELANHLVGTLGGKAFRDTASKMRRALSGIVWLPEDAVQRSEYLSPLFSLAKDQKRLVVASLNYDNTIELLGAKHQIPANTGIQHWKDQGTLGFDGKGLHYIKLHGSLDWKIIPQGSNEDQPLPYNAIAEATKEELETGKHEPAIVFGRGNKLTAEGPFLELLRAFQSELAASDELVVIGYSFRDTHINHCITTWLNGNKARRLTIIDNGAYPSEFRKRLTESKMGSRLSEIKERASEGLRNLSSRNWKP